MNNLNEVNKENTRNEDIKKEQEKWNLLMNRRKNPKSPNMEYWKKESHCPTL